MSRPVAVHAHQDPDTGIEGWLVVDSLVEGLAFGGMRVHAGTTQDEVGALARCMSAKLRPHGSPVGGAKAGLCCDPGDPRLSRALKAFASAWAGPLSSRVILGKDMGASNSMIDALYVALGKTQLHLVSGAQMPERIRDLVGYRSHMTGLGVAWAAHEVLGDAVRGARVAIQGFGAVGAGSAVRLSELGARIDMVSTVAGAWAGSQPGGLEAALPRDEALAADVDLLILAAGSGSLGVEHVHDVRAPIVVEGANMGITPEAEALLHRRGIRVVPDLLASASSAAMVGTQLRHANGLDESTLWRRIEDTLRGAVERACRESRASGESMRHVALCWGSAAEGVG